MMRFALFFPEIAMRETRSMKVLEPSQRLPRDEYAFNEMYCTERGCDCRRVIVNVLARHARQHVATISHAFEKPAADAPVPEQTFLDPLNRQSPLAPALLDLFVNIVLADESYRQRLIRHYRMFKNVVEDPAHPAHRLLHSAGFADRAGQGAKPGGRIAPPPPRSGKRKWR